jgi:hypothetical protein
VDRQQYICVTVHHVDVFVHSVWIDLSSVHSVSMAMLQPASLSQASSSSARLAPDFDLEEEDRSDDNLSYRQELYQIRDAIRKQDRFVLEQTETRNVIMVGRTRSGKCSDSIKSHVNNSLGVLLVSLISSLIWFWVCR